MSQLTALKSTSSLHGIAGLLGYTASGLSFILYKKAAALKYTKFEIPKRGGGTRQISAPSSDLKLLQRRVADLLQNCAELIRVANGRDDQISHGFKRKRSIITNAKVHRNRRYVFNLDLKDFFGHINFGRVRGFFIKDRDFSLHPDVATILAQIACYENALPQGSPCSPVISNLVAHILDIHLVQLAANAGCSYSRYADDLTFSTNKRSFPPAIAERDAAQPHKWLPGK
jgi:retron-type reverse transcriptase